MEKKLIPFIELSKGILEGFDWDRVHKSMIATNWVWSFGADENGNERYGTPDIGTLKRKGYNLLHEVYVKGKGSISTAGFTAGWDDDELYLVFTLCEWSDTAFE